MRGKEKRQGGKNETQGITPAYAGKSALGFVVGVVHRDHPRICGEKTHSTQRARRLIGSPPHMRGKAHHVRIGHASLRITPAYAGKSIFGRLFDVLGWDHPRICGEKRMLKTKFFHNLGSPPHMRGKGEPKEEYQSITGITPAYAGKRLKRSRSTVPPVAIVPLFPSVCNKPVVSDGSPAVRDAPLFLPAENAVPASPAYNLRSL